MDYYLSIGRPAFEEKHGSIEGTVQTTKILDEIKRINSNDTLDVDKIKTLWGERFNDLFKVTGKKGVLLTDIIAINKRHRKCLSDGHRYD